MSYLISYLATQDPVNTERLEEQTLSFLKQLFIAGYLYSICFSNKQQLSEPFNAVNARFSIINKLSEVFYVEFVCVERLLKIWNRKIWKGKSD